MVDNKLSQLLFGHVKILQKQLEHLLEKEPLSPAQPPRAGFEARTDCQNLKLYLDPQLGSIREKVTVVFSQIAAFFESGILFQKNSSTVKAIGAFDQGQYFPLKGIEIEVSFRFPQMSLIEVRRVHSREVFTELKNLNVVRDDKSEALIFSPHPDYIFLVTSQLAEPWLKPHIEKIQAQVLIKLGDL